LPPEELSLISLYATRNIEIFIYVSSQDSGYTAFVVIGALGWYQNKNSTEPLDLLFLSRIVTPLLWRLNPKAKARDRWCARQNWPYCPWNSTSFASRLAIAVDTWTRAIRTLLDKATADGAIGTMFFDGFIELQTQGWREDSRRFFNNRSSLELRKL